jgi:Anti-sigma-D factor RsdA to sigma factor binding region
MSERNDPVVPFGRPYHRNGSGGVHPSDDMPTRRLRRIETEESLDLVAVQADDELLSALAAGMTVSAPGSYGYDADDHIAAILASWKAEIDEEPIPELVDLDTAVAIVRAAARSEAPAAQRRRRLVPVAAAATAAVITLSGLTVGSAAAEPGSVFWPVSKVLFSERAASIEAADRAESHITRAKAALIEGRPDVAAMELQQAQTDLGQVRPQEGKDQLVEVQAFLVAKAVETPSGVATDPGTPLRSDTARKVPVGAALTDSPDPSAGSVATTTPAPTTTVAPVVPGPESPTPPPASPTSTSEPAPEPTPPPTPVEGVPDQAPPGTTTTGMGATTDAAPPDVVPS